MTAPRICPFVEYCQARGIGINPFTPPLAKEDHYCVPSADGEPTLAQCCMQTLGTLLKRGVAPEFMIINFAEDDERFPAVNATIAQYAQRTADLMVA